MSPRLLLLLFVALFASTAVQCRGSDHDYWWMGIGKRAAASIERDAPNRLHLQPDHANKRFADVHSNGAKELRVTF